MRNIYLSKLTALALIMVFFTQCHNPVEKPAEIVTKTAVQCLEMLCNIETCDYEVEEGFIPKNSFLSTLLDP